MSIRIAAYANGDDALVAWQDDAPIPGCLGFALYRRRNGKEEIVENRIGWETLVGKDRPAPGAHKPSTVWPIQRYYWSDYDARPGDKVQYRVVPMITQQDGVTDPLTPANNLASAWSDEITVSPGDAKGICAYFNRGVVMSQAVARRLKAAGGTPTKSLKAAIADPANETRKYLSGQLGETLAQELENGAKNGWEIHAALFELDDDNGLIKQLQAYGKRAHVILSNGAHEHASDDENVKSRAQLKGVVDLRDVRMLGTRHLAHNKFCVFTDGNGVPQRVWTGSQNWTKTGLCTQANNSLLIHDTTVAKAFRQQWDNLVAAGDEFTEALFKSNSKPRSFNVDGAKTTLWFAPNKAAAGEAVGPDLVFAKKFIDNAKSGILFLMFNPGPANSLLNAILDRVNDPAKPQIHVIGVINQDPSSTKTKVELFTGRQKQTKTDGLRDIIQPDGLDKDVAAQWLEEITRGQFLGGVGHAMIHSKVVVVDPFGPNPVVMTGSHNLGPAASLRNDENLLIIENDPELAKAYVVNIGGLHNAYRWRFARATEKGARAYHGLHPFAKWQQPYHDVDALKTEIAFWVGERGKKMARKPVTGRRHPSQRVTPR
jgi:phosphatidylserine/phosphatidylglycerophosphate/cardiolipin synthase-like enzyme